MNPIPPVEQRESLSEMLRKFSNPTEEELYHSFFKKEWWSLDGFCAAITGLSPEKYEKILKNTGKDVEANDIKRAIEATKITRLFYKDFEEIYSEGKVESSDGFSMTPWRFIKWVASKGHPIKQKFIEALPYYLLEIYLEFAASNTPLRIKPKSSRQYHKALYLKAAQKLMDDYEYRLSRQEIYGHWRMQNVQRQIRALGGKYEQRTITESWLATLEERKRGRPKKKELLKK